MKTGPRYTWIVFTLLTYSGCTDHKIEPVFSDTGASTDSNSYTNDSDSWDSTLDYPVGPYGFKSSLNIEDSIVWTKEGETIPNVCLPNHLDETVCLRDFYQAPHVDAVLLDFSIVNCIHCTWAADSAQEYIDALRENQWNIKWITVIEKNSINDPPTQSDALEWVSIHSADDDRIVLYDPTQQWISHLSQNGVISWPTVVVADTASMLSWIFLQGWRNPSSNDWSLWLDQWSDILDYCYLNSYPTAPL